MTAAAWLESTDIEIKDEDKIMARRYLIKHKAHDICEILGL
jgi:hypothetical protein